MNINSDKHTPRMVTTAPKFVDHDELHGRQAYERLFGPIPAEGTTSAGDERDLRRFKQMHFCARKMKSLLKQHGRRCVRMKEFKRFARMHQRLRDGIASDNLGLVYDLYKRSRIINVDGDELLSEGMMALTRAINTFDPWRGFRFSTYACNAIVRAFYRCGLKESRRRQHEPLNFETELERSDWGDTRRSEESHLYVERLSRILEEDTADLTPMEKDVISRRFPFDTTVERLTLADIGKRMNLSKERVRQIQNSALGKLRAALDADAVLV